MRVTKAISMIWAEAGLEWVIQEALELFHHHSLNYNTQKHDGFFKSGVTMASFNLLPCRQMVELRDRLIISLKWSHPHYH